MNNVLARNIIREEVLPTYIRAYAESDKEDSMKYEDIIDALYTALNEMEQNEDFRVAINEFCV